MEIGEELMSWLKDKKKEYTARLEFAIKVWQSVDFVYINKYEVICKWLAETLLNESTNNGELPTVQLQQLFGLRAQPGLVSVETKTELIKNILKCIQRDVNGKSRSGNSLAHSQLLQSLINFELVQDALRADYELLMSSYGTLFECYEAQLLNPKDEVDSKQLRHADFVLPLLQQLRDYVQRAQHHKRLLEAYTNAALQPLCQLLLQLREHGLCCFEQLAALEQQLTESLNMGEVIKRISQQPLHVRLLLLESLMLNQRFDIEKLSKVLKFAFGKLQHNPLEQPLALATHALESLRKHNISLQFQMPEKVTALEFVTGKLFKLVEHYQEEQLGAVLMMLCAALRLNPMLLEPNVYQITVWMLTKPKRNDNELALYSDYLVQLLDMFRRLSRAERFVMQLLKSLREWLRKYELQLPASDAKRQKLAKKAEQSAVPLNPYLQLLLKPHQSVASAASVANDRLAQTWPSQSAGAAFTRLISHLMAKPSIVIWKMLLHTFDELLEPTTPAVLPVNLNFALELQVALLCQYLLGTRLTEQVQQHQSDVELCCRHTAQVLQQFARHLLAREHNRSTMNAFLECVDRATSFELQLAYYWPDGLAKSQQELQLPYKFLPSDEWELIQQRVHNFGKSSCRQRLQRLELQLVQTNWLLLPNQRLEPCPDALLELVPPQLLSHLSRAQKQLRLQQPHQLSSAEELWQDAECVELLALQLLQDYADSLKAEKIQGTLLLKQLQSESDESGLSAALRQHCGSSKQPALPVATTDQLIDALQRLPLAQLMSSIKLRLWLLIFTLYHDVRRAQLTEQANQLLDQLTDLLHFGQPLPICSHFPQLPELLQLVPIDGSDNNGWRFYEMLFGRCIRRVTAGSELFLTSCAEHFREQLQQTRTLELVECRLLLLAIETLSGATGVQARRMQRHLQPLLEIYGQFVAHKFRSVKKSPADAAEFVQRTLSGFAVYLSSCINRASKQQRELLEEQKKQLLEEKPKEKKKKEKEQEQEEEKSEQVPNPTEKSTCIDENLRRICKIYIGHSLNYRNVHAIKLLNVALTHREQLHLDQDEIEFLLDSYWRQLNADIEAATLDIQSIEPAIKLIIGYKTNEDFLLLLRRLSTQLEGMQRPETEAQHTSLQNVLILLQLFSKCSLSSIKGAMLNEHFELLIGNISLRLPGVEDASYRQHVVRLLEAQRALASNRTVPLTGETLDCILGTMLDMNIKRFIISGGKLDDFLLLHAGISENLLLLLRQHATLMSDRAAQLTALCQDLIEAIVCYRSDRKQAQNLNDQELDGLAELALKLVTLLAGIAAGPQALAVKRVAPFLLIFTIKQMVTTERPTTLFEKIKVHLDRICHELISLCDHRAGHFILRSSNEAGARMYQNLVKEHDKYHKFRGKV
ncbi:uncharacterized protein LOC117793614 [Drosophila innubila]|uniref:uncharacterized protein LOC117793614 n=1 Tax=Drosophila innubila TaxID=198719 RepID=UPI00148B6C06|nr:uncharacterized protein LOC117793614 [Drosophila innubila]